MGGAFSVCVTDYVCWIFDCKDSGKMKVVGIHYGGVTVEVSRTEFRFLTDLIVAEDQWGNRSVRRRTVTPYAVALMTKRISTQPEPIAFGWMGNEG